LTFEAWFCFVITVRLLRQTDQTCRGC